MVNLHKMKRNVLLINRLLDLENKKELTSHCKLTQFYLNTILNMSMYNIYAF